VHDDPYSPLRIHRQRDQPPLAFSIRIFDGDASVVAKRLLGMREANPMFLEVRLRLVEIELDLDDKYMLYMHMHMHMHMLFKCAVPQPLRNGLQRRKCRRQRLRIRPPMARRKRNR